MRRKILLSREWLDASDLPHPSVCGKSAQPVHHKSVEGAAAAAFVIEVVVVLLLLLLPAGGGAGGGGGGGSMTPRECGARSMPRKLATPRIGRCEHMARAHVPLC